MTWYLKLTHKGFPGSSDGKETACSAGDLGLIPGSGRFPWRKEWLSTPLFLPGEFQGQRQTDRQTHIDTHTHTDTHTDTHRHTHPQASW